MFYAKMTSAKQANMALAKYKKVKQAHLKPVKKCGKMSASELNKHFGH